MPHVTVKVLNKTPEDKKMQLADAIVQEVVHMVGCGEESVSVAIVEVGSRNWKEKVYETDVLKGAGKLYKRPGYKM